ncbi:hypothetical protein TNIN_78731 [Trichonephila inaurata madagascariensis]|uniref:Uncharacterized protein n=1 Tax=Trichonephila inaurata madagascariensis TaxID=2747483 RepID=A0A8X6MBM8_9ARAC|nr:hypothetical protein TNIN_78731 [Trichonephila inaurata madagascariensis]
MQTKKRPQEKRIDEYFIWPDSYRYPRRVTSQTNNPPSAKTNKTKSKATSRVARIDRSTTRNTLKTVDDFKKIFQGLLRSTISTLRTLIHSDKGQRACF